jgi:hypothetical protein
MVHCRDRESDSDSDSEIDLPLEFPNWCFYTSNPQSPPMSATAAAHDPDSAEVLAILHALRFFPKHGVMFPGQISAETGINLAGRADLLAALAVHPRVTDHGGGWSYSPIVGDVHSSADLMKRLRVVRCVP